MISIAKNVANYSPLVVVFKNIAMRVVTKKSKSNNIYWQDKICVICQKRFTPTGGAQRYCSECANLKAKSDNAKSHRVYYNETMKQKKDEIQNTVVQLVAMNIKKLRIHDLILLILGILNVATLILTIVK